MIKVNTNDLIAAIKFVQPCCGKDESRLALNHIHMKQLDATTLLIESCDGHRMAQIKIAIKETDTGKAFEAVVVPLKIAKSIFKTRLESDGTFIRVTDEATGESFSKRLFLGEYIDLTKVVPTEEPTSEIALNPEYLSQMAQAFRCISDKYMRSGVLMEMHGDMGMVVCTDSRDRSKMIGLLPLRR
jgi:DNA polymerase III sliding clamp (beta) subunit (PCNA family)